MTVRKLLLRMVIASAVLLSAPALAITLCTTPDGKTYAGDNPPADCVVKNKYENFTPPPVADKAPGETPSAETPPEVDGAAAAGAELRRKLIEERAAKKAEEKEIAAMKRVVAVHFTETFDKVYGNGRFLEGRLANSAEFPVYNVRVCVGGNCQMARPPTLQPGSEGTYAFEAAPNWRRGGEMTVTWDVTPDGR